MSLLKKALFLTTALTVALPAAAAVVTINDTRTIGAGNTVYQSVTGGVVVRDPARLTFTGGSVFDYTAYGPGIADGESLTILNPETGEETYVITQPVITGNMIIENGDFYDSATGGIIFKKGHPLTQKTETEYDGEGNPSEKVYRIVSNGNFYVNGGRFYFWNRTDNELMLAASVETNSRFYLNNGVFNFKPGAKATFGSPSHMRIIEVHGGTFQFDGGGEMLWQGSTLTFQDDDRYTATNFSGAGTVSVHTLFNEDELDRYGGSTTAFINTKILWQEGTLNLINGVMLLSEDVDVGSFTYGNGYATLNVAEGKTLSVVNNFVMQSTSFLIGDGTLKLIDGASADFNQLKFGEIIAQGDNAGVVSFAGASEVNKMTIDAATLNVNANVSVADTLILKNDSTAYLNGNLSVGHLTFDTGRIVYSSADSTLQFNDTSTIYNTAQIEVDNAVENGNIIINSTSSIAQNQTQAGADETVAVSLNFEDGENTAVRFENNKLSIKGQPNGIVNFNQTNGVLMKSMTLALATANFNKGTSDFDTVVLGNNDNSKPGLVTVAEGARLNVGVLTSHFGSEARVNGTMAVGTGSLIDGNSTVYSSVSGTGTLVATGDVTFNGLFNNLDTLQIDASASDALMTLAGQTGKDKVRKIRFSGANEGRLEINAGMLTINSLVFDDGSNGNILIGAGGTLALDAGTGSATDIMSGTGTISGPTGTLRLVGQTGIDFGGGGGGIGTLGTLEIGFGRAKVSQNLTIGSVSFYETGGGTLEVGENTTLTLSTLTTGAGNSVTGAGTLKLTGGTSTFGGATDISTIHLEGTGKTIYFAGDATIALLSSSEASGNTVSIASGKKLSLAADTGTRLTVQGAGTIRITGSNAAELTLDDPNKLEIAAGATATVGGTVKNIDAAGTLTLDSETIVSQSLTMQEGGVLTGTTLRLNGGTAVFTANSLQADTFVGASGTTTSFTGNNAPTLLNLIDSTAGVHIGTGATLTVNQDMLNGTIGGAGTLKLNKNGMNVTAPIVNLNTLTVAQPATLNGVLRNVGTLNAQSSVRLNADAVVGTVNADAPMTVQQTLTVANEAVFADNTLTGSGTLVLNGSGLFGENDFSEGSLQTAGFEIAENATFQLGTLVQTSQGTVIGGTLSLIGQNTGLSYNFAADRLNIAGKLSVNRGTTVIKNLTGNGTLTVASGAAVHTAGASTVAVESSGTLYLRDNLTIGSGTFNNGSLVDMRALTLTADTMTFNAGSKLSFTTKGMTPLLSVGTTLTANGVELIPKVSYDQDTTTFKLADKMWTPASTYVYTNKLYKLEAVNCDGALCFTIGKIDGAAAEIAGGTGGSTNNSHTASAVLDGAVFDENDKMFPIASRMSELAQESNGKAYQDALTALAPDVSGSVTNASVQTQTKLAQVVFNRMDTLRDTFGRFSTFRARGRAGGSGYDSRLMRASDYYRRAGYYDEDARPVRATPRRYTSPTDEQRDYYYRRNQEEGNDNRTRTTSWQRRYDKRRIPVYVGAWAQALYNKTSYKSASKQDGFEGDTTGFAAGFDAVFLDVFAAGAGYSHSSSDIKALGRDTTYDSNTFFLYGMYKPSRWYVSGILNYGTGTFDERKNVGGINVSDNYDSSMFGGQLMVGYTFDQWRPAVGVRYASISQDGRTDSVGQVIGSSSNKVVTAVAETRWSKPLESMGRPELELYGAVTYDFSNSADEATVRLSNGTTYTVSGSDPDPAAAQVGAELSWTFKEKMELSTRYELEAKKDYFSHTLMATFRYMF